MAQKRNDIIEEQRRARQEFLKLKQMQNGELQPEAKPSEIAVAPATFSEKIQNFWYHYKVHTILIAFIMIVITIATTQCAAREKYDVSVMYFAFSPAVPGQLSSAEEYFEKFAEDLNGDGEVNVKVIDCSFNPDNRDVQYQNATLTKVQSVVAVEQSVMLYVVDEKAEEYFINAFGYSLFEGEPIKMGEDFYKQTTKEKITLPEGLKMGLRIMKGTSFEGKEEAEAAYKASQKLFEKLKKQNGIELCP